MKAFIMCSTVVAVLTGCASTKVEDVKSTGLVEIPVSQASRVPDWFLAKQTDTKTIFVTATDTSRDMQFAIDKAMLNAQVQLAERLGVKIDSLKRESAAESGYGVKDVQREIDRVSKVRVSQDLNFYTREHLSVVKEDNFYRAFVMLKLTDEEARRLTTKENKTTREEKFKQLDTISEIKPVN